MTSSCRDQPTSGRPGATAGLLCATLLFACSAPTMPRGPQGSWELAAVAGSVLPASIGPLAEIVGGDLELSSDGTWRKRTRATIGGVPFQDWHEGRWSADGGRVELEPDAGGESAVAVWNGNVLEIQGARTMRYVRTDPTRHTVAAR